MTPGPSTNGSVAARPIGNIPFSPDRLNNSNKPAAPSDPIATTGGQWKQLSFFDKDEILQSSSITAQVATALETWLQAYNNRVTYIKQMRRKAILFTIGEEDSATPTLKVWNVEKSVVEVDKPPVLIQTKKISYKAKVFPVTAFAALESMAQIAIGLENGVVIVYRGDLSRARQVKTVVVHEGSETVTGLGFHEDGSEITLYIITLAKIIACVTTNKDTKNVLEEQGTEIGLSAATPNDQTQEMAMACDEVGEKTLLTWFRGYLVLVSKECPLRTNVLTEFGNASESSVISEHKSSADHMWSTGAPTPGHVLTIYDLKSKFIAFKGSFGTRRFDASVGTAVGEPIHHVLVEWGDLYIITKENKIFRLHETDLDSKLSLLYAKHMYNLAISIMTYPPTMIHTIGVKTDFGTRTAISGTTDASTNKPDEAADSVIMDIHKRYGDYLYDRGEFDLSVRQYIKTIGHLEPSYVIRKFLDAQRIYNLTAYLQALHDHQLANPSHTTLLLNCYTKLKDVNRLDAFITNPKLLFDVETAIRVCRQAGYFTHALKLAARFEQYEWHLRVLIEDLQQYDEALVYLAKLPRHQQIKRALPMYGFVLVKHRPRRATEALVRACTVSVPSKQGTTNDALAQTSTLVASGGLVNGATGPTLSVTTESVNSEELAQPQDFMPFFVDQPVWCITFIESVLFKRWNVAKDILGTESLNITSADQTASAGFLDDSDSNNRQILWDTLLELLLSQLSEDLKKEPSPTQLQAKPSWSKRIMALLKNTQATLVLCKTHNFNDGILFLLQRLGLYHDYLDFHIHRGEDALVLQTCQSFGDVEPSLWTKALTFFIEKGVYSSKRDEQDGSVEKSAQCNLLQVLDQIQKRKLLSQLQIVQLLSKNSNVTLGMVREFLIKSIEIDTASINESQQLISSYQEDTAKMRLAIAELESGSVTFQSTRCDLCRQQLELPTVHFYCKHAYHHRCLGDADQECPKCAPEHRMVQELVRAQRLNSKRHEHFVQKLGEGSEYEDKFSLIAEYFSKNIFAE
ncbi:hypothetical protein BATDEDRAFT_22251 [Batrachochytrium dendrobatidis JAM81]|uniref:E3 ubiquitin-protein ligase PEP5 n=1 Tax=Batrachochytrium dendrobatidis (strain JAM81 / FGSC 10211) TaxID=684364 RepID=F4NTB2_BATDJ|nr:tethering complex subunit PEP5 [Batrachochytrium dendrobatidis JAM81]EGF84319.1 hypothetical protein BATDEDRAFT_22251 [Batrachochytrium dendrobatidis JAM81]|eukprot:XP_006675511.1 hypothetical protein BATDEDRAFT_22251 [Batrachochytrium dendrobatidis JAM81]